MPGLYYDQFHVGQVFRHPIRRTLTVHWNGSTWTRVASANPGTGDNWLTNVVTPAGSSTSWATGTSAAGTLVERTG